MFTFNLAVIPAVLLSLSLVSALYLVTFFRAFIMKPVEKKRLSHDSDCMLPGVSVIVYCRDNAMQHRRLLPSILKQNYEERDLEVIVVNDGCSEDVKDVVNLLSIDHRNLYITFIPQQAHNLSRRKLAMTLGVKAAHNDYVIFTNAEAVIDSVDWLSSMMLPFANGAGVVVGNASSIKPAGGFVAFDQLADTVTWMSGALKGCCHRCSNFNWGFRRDLFFENKGFSTSLNLHQGDDDIFFSEIAARDKVEVVLNDESLVRYDLFNQNKIYRLSKLSHIFTGKRVSRKSRLMMATGSWAIWLWLISLSVAAAVTLPDMFALTVGVVFSLIMLVVLSLSWRKLSKSLSIPVCWWLAPLFMLCRPIYNFCFLVVAHIKRERNYTWV